MTAWRFAAVVVAIVFALPASAWDEESAEQMIAAIERSTTHGLDPNHYHLQAIRASSGDARDALLTEAFLALGSDLLNGRVDSETMARREWCVAPRSANLTAILESALATHTVAETLTRLAPQHPQYENLRAALAYYRFIPDWPSVDEGPPLRRGDAGARVEALRARLALPHGSSFDETTDVALRDFQRHHGLEPDGIAGRATLAELNVPRAVRIEQLRLTLERWRWMPERLGERHVLVNVAAFSAAAFDNGEETLSMRVIVGKDYTRTPFFSAGIRGVIPNPYWYVPDSIAWKELYPKQHRNSGFFASEHIEVLSGGALRQKPGPWNSLGRLKLDMPNRFNVYLHDTPARWLFNAEVRTFSHGCIRMEKSVAMAAWLLRTTESEVEAAIESGQTVAIAMETAVPVYVLYWTAFVAPDGHIEFRRDIYGSDARLAEALR